MVRAISQMRIAISSQQHNHNLHMKKTHQTFTRSILIFLIITGSILCLYVLTNEGTLESILLNIPPSDQQKESKIETEVLDFFQVERKNLIDELPIPTRSTQPDITPDPVSYRNEVILRIKNFANALESFLEINERLRDSPGLFYDSGWRHEMGIRLDLFVTAGRNLGTIEAVPEEYRGVQESLGSIGIYTQNLKEFYLKGIDSNDIDQLRLASRELDNIYLAMKQAESEMIKAGWQP